jgi:predicted dehydrogenase
MSAAAEAANTVTACCFNWRYAPACQIARKAIRSGQIGAVRDIQFCLSITAGEDRFSWFIVGYEGSLRIPDSGTVVVRQRHDDDEPGELEIASADKVVLSTDLQQHTWSRLIEDFIGAARNDDKDHENHPSLATLNDGLRTEEVIDAARRSSSTGRWAIVGG